MGTVRKRGKKWYIDFIDASGKRRRKVAGTTKKQAERILAELETRKYYEKESIPVLDKISVEELWERFISMKRKRVRPRTMETWKPRLNFWKEKHLQKSKNFSLLPPLIIDKIVDELSDKYSAKTVNDYVNVLQQIYRYAKDLNLLQQNPAEKIKRLKESPEKLPRFLSKKEVSGILKHSNDFYKNLFQFFLYTGMRRDEVRFLEWSEIDLKNKIIRLGNKENFTTKSGKSRNIPMHPIVEKILKKRPQDTTLVFESPEGGEFGRGTWRTVLLQAAKRANVKDVTLHTFRHTFASWLVMEGVDLNTVRELLGHSDIKTTMKYAHLAPEHVKRAVERLSFSL